VEGQVVLREEGRRLELAVKARKKLMKSKSESITATTNL
jgi:hypothetical protein